MQRRYKIKSRYVENFWFSESDRYAKLLDLPAVEYNLADSMQCQTIAYVEFEKPWE